MASDQDGTSHQQLVAEMFPDLDLVELLAADQQLTMDQMANLVLDSMDKIPIKTQNMRPTNSGHRGDLFNSKLECPVCMEEHPMRAMVFCTPPVMEVGTARQSPWKASVLQMELGRVVDTPITHAPTSSIAAQAPPDDAAVHGFCHACVREAATVASDELPLAEGAVSLRCMVQNCQNPLPYAEMCSLLEDAIKKKLDERIVEENLGLAFTVANLERCRKCNFATEMEVSPEVNKVFFCHDCYAEYCRLCGKDWEGHMGISCSELAELEEARTIVESKKREFEHQLNEVVIRNCPRCNLAFVKSSGCNLITCRCGMTLCYLCRASSIDVSHFSAQACHQFEDADAKDGQVIVDIKRKAAIEGVILDDTNHHSNASNST